MTRVLQLVQYFAVGGLERMVCGLADRGRDHGVETTAVAYLAEGPMRAAMDRAGAHTVYLPGAPGRRPRLPVQLARLIRQRRVDVLHTHHLGPFIYGSLAARLTGTRHVHTEHSLEFYDTLRRRTIGRLMPLQAEVVCVAPALAAWRHEHFGDTPRVIPNGIPIPPARTPERRRAARRHLGLPADRFVVGAVARLSPEKDLVTLVEAVARRPEATLVLVGDGADRPRIEARVAALDLGERVHLLGQRLDVDALLPAFDVIALSSRREGLPLALLEGMAHGLPIVATAVGEIPALAAAGAGRVAPPSDPEGLAAALAVYLDAGARDTDGARARALVERDYSLESMTARYATLYR